MRVSPKAGPAHQTLRRFIGSWNGREQSLSDEVGAGNGHVRFQTDVEGLVLLQEYRQEIDGDIVFRGHGVMAIDPDNGDVLWWWFDSNNMPPLNPSRGQWQGDTLIFERNSDHAMLRHRYAFDGNDRYRFSVELKLPDQADYQTLLEADYHHERLGLHA